MPALSTKTESMRVAQVLAVLSVAAKNDLTIREACEQEGIEYPTFQRWYAKRRDSIIDIMEGVAIARTQQIITLAQIKQDGIDHMAKRVQIGALETKDLINIMKYVDGALEQALTVSGSYDEEQEKEAQAYAKSLTGPQLEEVDSRFTVQHNKQTEKKEKPEQDVIEGNYTDL